MSEKFLIAPFTSGLVKNMPVWATPEDSFHELENAYIHRGVIRKRFGSSYIGTGENTELLLQLKSRLRIIAGTTDGNGDISSAADALPVGSVFKPGQMFSIGDEIFTVPEAGAPVVMLTTGAATTHTYNTTTGAYDIQGAAGTTNCYWYPCEPVMGLAMYEAGAISDHPAIAYDTRFAYRFTGGGWSRVGAQTYSGNNLNYFWSTNFEGDTADTTALFSTNFHKNGDNSDSMYSTLDLGLWTAFEPATDATAGPFTPTRTIKTAKIMIPFKSRLLLFNTYEKVVGAEPPPHAYTSHVNRVRFSAVNSPLHEASFVVAKQAGYFGGGFIDAPTEEEIVSVGYVKDRMIVYFERSTYELVYTGIASLPFVWQKISSELGSDSAFSTVPVESGAFTIGATGVHLCNGVSVTRIDQKIPDEIFKLLQDAEALQRIHGIKDYFDELIYWTIPAQKADDAQSYPDKVLVYNYISGAWAFYDDSITAFGYFEQSLGDTWESDYQSWEDDTSSWDTPEDVSGNRKVIAGNQQGFVFAISNSTNSNAPVLQVSKIAGENLTVIEHNLSTGDYVRLHNSGIIENTIFRVSKVIDANTIELAGLVAPGYSGGATLARVSKISIKSTAWNPYIKQGNNVSLEKITFAVKKTVSGEITVNAITSQADLDIIELGSQTGAMLGSNVLETFPYDLIPLESSQALLWHAVYFQEEGNSVQIHLTWTDEQMRNNGIVTSEFEIQGLLLETSSAESIG